jgi:hypothetical protein
MKIAMDEKNVNPLIPGNLFLDLVNLLVASRGYREWHFSGRSGRSILTPWNGTNVSAI